MSSKCLGVNNRRQETRYTGHVYESVQGQKLHVATWDEAGELGCDVCSRRQQVLGTRACARCCVGTVMGQ